MVPVAYSDLILKKKGKKTHFQLWLSAYTNHWMFRKVFPFHCTTSSEHRYCIARDRDFYGYRIFLLVTFVVLLHVCRSLRHPRKSFQHFWLNWSMILPIHLFYCILTTIVLLFAFFVFGIRTNFAIYTRR